MDLNRDTLTLEILPAAYGGSGFNQEFAFQTGERTIWLRGPAFTQERIQRVLNKMAWKDQLANDIDFYRAALIEENIVDYRNNPAARTRHYCLEAAMGVGEVMLPGSVVVDRCNNWSWAVVEADGKSNEAWVYDIGVNAELGISMNIWFAHEDPIEAMDYTADAKEPSISQRYAVARLVRRIHDAVELACSEDYTATPPPTDTPN